MDGLCRLRPGPAGLRTDLGDTRLLTMRPDTLPGAKPLAECLITSTGLAALLRDERLPDGCLVPQACLWQREERVGLERDHGRRTARHGMLYAASHVRLARGVGLGLLVQDEAPDEGAWQPAPLAPLAPLGGFQRMAEIEEVEGWPMPASVPRAMIGQGGMVRYVVVLTAPVPIKPLGAGWNRPGGPLAESLPGVTVAACLDRPQWIGGWSDGYGGKRGTLPMRPCLGPGSVWFLEASAEELAAKPDFPPPALGTETDRRQGFGACLIGRWPDDGETR